MARRSISRPDEIAYYLAHAPTGTAVGKLVEVAWQKSADSWQLGTPGRPTINLATSIGR
ncbi:hypothetical protein Q3Y56_00455 [Streptomyces sp. XD-27]|nr:hypothetical protein [Streptomyces sp. XD-27]WKX68622.1 hypothetical protein Q3Y56_00455 [Streptomyces sp. XD-27]